MLKEHFKNVEMNAQLHLNFTVQKHWDITCLFVHFLLFYSCFLLQTWLLGFLFIGFIGSEFWSGSVVSLFIDYGYASTHFCLYAITLFDTVTYRNAVEVATEGTALYSTLEI